jgi:putative ABC transport system substrate-binding protein
MRRRDFITLISGAAAAWPIRARAQPAAAVRRIGFLLGSGSDPDSAAKVAAFRGAIAQLGWTEGKNIEIAVRWGEGDAERVKDYAAELVAAKPDVLVSDGGPPVSEFHRLTSTIPIVFAEVPDPVEIGLVASLASPGGNVTGFTHFEFSMGGKWLQTLKELAPGMTRVAFLLQPEHPAWPGFLRAITAAGASAGVDVTPAGIHDAVEIKDAIEAFAAKPNGGLIVLPSPPTTVYRDVIIALAARHNLPAIYPFRYYVADGGLISYTTDILDLFRRAAGYVNRILKGEKPANLPVQAPTNYQLVINLKTATALGLEVPPSMQQLADEIIE